MKIIVLFLTVFFPFVNYYVYHLLKDHELGYEKRKEQGVHPLLRLFKVMENIALGSAVLYIVISFFFGGPREFSIYILCIGTLISSAGIILLYYSRKELGKNFSPCHSAHLPMKYVDTGAYKYMRHPIYIANLLKLRKKTKVTCQ